MRARDWSRSPLGPPERWPQSLRSVVGLMLGSKFPMFVAWGPGLGFLYNDGYSEILGAKHPAALGDRFEDIWAEIWHDIAPMVDAALNGRASYYEDLPLLMNRRGFDERAWFTFSYSPVRDERGAVAGMFCACEETTGRVLAERQIATESRRFSELFEQAPSFMAVLRGPDHVIELANPAYLRLVRRDVVGRTVADVLPDAVEQGYLDLLDRVYRTGEAVTESSARFLVQPAANGPADERFLDFVLQPITDANGALSGILVQGVDVTDAHRAELALRESEDHYRHAVELDPQTSWTSAPDGQLDQVNRRWFEWTGTSGLGSSYADGLHEDDRQRTFDVWARSLATGEPYDIEHRVKMRDGSYRWMHSRAYPRRDEAGRVVKWYGTTEDIHDRYLAEAEQRESEARLRALADNLPIAVVYQLETSRDLNERRYTFVSASSERLLGVPADQAMADASIWLAGLHPDDLSRVAAAERDALASGGTLDVEARFRRADGRVVRGRVVSSPRAGPDNRLLWDGMFLDITDVKEAEERERFLLTLADMVREAPNAEAVTCVAAQALGRRLGVARAGYGEIDAAQSVVSVPRDWTNGTGVASLAGQARLLDGFGPDVIAELKAGRTLVVEDFRTDPRAGPDFAATWESINTRALIVVPLVRGGRLRAILYLHEPRPRRWTAGDVELARSVAERAWDAAERAQAEAALRDETRSLETLNRIGSALAGELDPGRLVQMVVDAGLELSGAALGAFLYAQADAAGDKAEIYVQATASERIGESRIRELSVPIFNARRVLRINDLRAQPHSDWKGQANGSFAIRSYMGLPVVSRSGEMLGALIFAHPEPESFTERHERLLTGIAAQAAVAIDNARLFQQVQQSNDLLESRVAARTLELEEAHEALRQSQKMEAVGQLTGGIAHDFNNMLAVVIGSLDLLGRRLAGDDARARRYLDAAADGARRAANLTQRLLAFSRQQPLRPEPVEANRLVTGMSDLLRHSLGPDIQLDVDLAPGLWRTHADPNQLENAILNLAVNARDAMPDGGRLTISTANVQPTGPDGMGDHVRIAVADTGIGMAEEVIAKAFDPFFTTKEVGKGTGLGLSQVYGFVRQSGGEVTIRSAPGRGTTIEIHLPRYHGVEEAADDEDGSELALGDAREVVLVVEDEPAVRQFSTDALSELGYRVLEADGAAAALRLLDAHPEVALLFTDVVMPEVNGAKLADEARRRRPTLRVLFTTGYARDAMSQNGVLEPGVELLAKPFTVEELAGKVRGVLDGELVDGD